MPTNDVAKSLMWLFVALLIIIGLGSGLCKGESNSKGEGVPLLSMLPSDAQLKVSGMGNFFLVLLAKWNVLVGGIVNKVSAGQGPFCALVAGLGGVLSAILGIIYFIVAPLIIITQNFDELSGGWLVGTLLAWLPMSAIAIVIWTLGVLIKGFSSPIFFYALLIGIVSPLIFYSAWNNYGGLVGKIGKFNTFPPVLAFSGIVISLILMKTKKSGPSQGLIAKVLKANS